MCKQVMAALAEAKGARKQTGKGKQEGAPGSEEDSDIYKIIRMIMQREFDPVRLPARRWLTLLASLMNPLLSVTWQRAYACIGASVGPRCRG